MKAVLDANLFVSATITSQGKPAQVLDAWRARRFTLVIRGDILVEIREVLWRPPIRKRHQWTLEQIDGFLAGLGETAIVTSGELAVQAIAEDPDDNRYLACAVEGEADYLVSGDQHLLKLGRFKGILIITAAQFLEILEGKV
jgi:uncharacterized protein